MSRSFKKYGIIKDIGMSRGEYNRRFRRVNRQRTKLGQDPKHLFEVVSSWSICDFKIRWINCLETEVYRHLRDHSKLQFEKERRRFYNK